MYTNWISRANIQGKSQHMASKTYIYYQESSLYTVDTKFTLKMNAACSGR